MQNILGVKFFLRYLIFSSMTFLKNSWGIRSFFILWCAREMRRTEMNTKKDLCRPTPQTLRIHVYLIGLLPSFLPCFLFFFFFLFFLLTYSSCSLSVSLFLSFFLDFFIFIGKAELQGKKEREVSSKCCFTPQLATTSGAGLVHSQEPEAVSFKSAT